MRIVRLSSPLSFASNGIRPRRLYREFPTFRVDCMPPAWDFLEFSRGIVPGDEGGEARVAFGRGGAEKLGMCRAFAGIQHICAGD